jgi:hypothetical protein
MALMTLLSTSLEQKKAAVPDLNVRTAVMAGVFLQAVSLNEFNASKDSPSLAARARGNEDS